MLTTIEIAAALNLTPGRVLQLAAERGLYPVVPGSGRRGHLWHAEAVAAMRDRQTRRGPRGPRKCGRSQ